MDVSTLSDADFLNEMAAGTSSLVPASAVQEEQQQEQPQQQEQQQEEAPSAAEETPADKSEGDTATPDEAKDGDKDGANDDKQPAGSEAEASPTGEGSDEKPEADKDKKPAEGAEADKNVPNPADTAAKPDGAVEKPMDYAAGYAALMAPLKANKKVINFNNPEEARQLMQLGANYGKRMQELAPSRKAVAMLENAGLLGNEDALSMLIDIHQKKPEAIKQLLKDAKVDTFDLDLSTESGYVPGVNKVTDKEVAFRTTVSEIMSQDGGQETIQAIDSSWDPESKQAAWDSPSIITAIHEARANGVYDRITSEVERRRALGQIAPTEPFLASYSKVGAELEAQALAARQEQKVAEAHKPVVPAAPIATASAAPAVDAEADARAKAAAATKSAPTAKPKAVNPLSMSDEDFMKKFGNLNLG